MNVAIVHGRTSKLTDRRAWLAKEWDTTPRTLDRIEMVGMRLLDQVFQARTHINAASDVVAPVIRVMHTVGRYREAFGIDQQAYDAAFDAVLALQPEWVHDPTAHYDEGTGTHIPMALRPKLEERRNP